MEITVEEKKYAEKMLDFISKSPSQFHACENAAKILIENGYTKFKETEDYTLERGGKYFVTRNGSSIIAFEIGEDVDNNYHFQIVASHLDSPTFKIKEIPSIDSDYYTTINLEGYGGGIYFTWVDRPLSLAGRIMIEEDGKITSKNVYIDKDLLIIPNVAIHLNNKINEDKLTLDKDLFPLFSSEKKDFDEFLKDYFSINNGQILGKDIYLVNRTRPAIFGDRGQFISSPKLDNLESAFTSLEAFISSEKTDFVKVYASFDSEEVGSNTMQGAMSTFMKDILERINFALNKDKIDYLKAISKSFLVSADNAHAIHPNRPEFYDKNNAPMMNKGIVIKENARQSYMTSAFSRAIFKSILKKNSLPYQAYANKSDIRGGSTLGNLSNIEVSMHGVDVGASQLAMHSSYETAGTKDVKYMVDSLKAFYNSNIVIDGDSVIIR